MSATENKSGLVMFVLAFVGTAVFFAYVLFGANEGPIDQNMWEAGPGFSAEDKAARNKSWRTSTPETILEGRKLSEANIFGEREGIFAQVLSGEFGSKETDIYRILTHGIPGTSMTRMDFLPASARWKMVHFIRSSIANPESAGDADWEALDQEGI